MPGAIPRTGATRSSRPPTSRVRLTKARGPRLAVNPARIEGGGPNNVVPDLAVLRVNFRPADAATTIARAQGAYRQRGRDGRGRARRAHRRCMAASTARPSRSTPAPAELFALVKDAGADLGLDIGWRATGGVCDGNNIAACGVPVVDTMGARGGAIHSPDEFLIVDSLAERAALSALTILRIAERGGPVTFRIRAARDADLQPSLRDGQADRRRLHQPARPTAARWRPSSTAASDAFARDDDTHRRRSVRAGARKCRDRRGARHLPDLQPGRAAATPSTAIGIGTLTQHSRRNSTAPSAPRC